jgi:hypothetical protein
MRRCILRNVSFAILLLIVNSSAFAEREDHKEFGDDFPSVVASTWLELLYDVVKAEKTTPPAASRIYGITEVYLRTAFGG